MDRRLRDGLPALIGNPLRDEGAAFRLVFATIGVLGLIALGSWISTWVGIGVLVALAAAAGWLAWRWRRSRRATGASDHATVLLVGDVREIDRDRAAALHAPSGVHVVDPGPDARAAVEEALRAFAVQEIVVLDPSLVELLHSRFVVPVRLAAAESYLPETAIR